MTWATAIQYGEPTLETPPLFAHQVRDVQTYLDKPCVFNQSDPGTGKTRTCIEVIKRLSPNRTLILAPKSILQPAWGNDFNKFAPEISYAIATAENREAAFKSKAEVIITNHDAVTWLVKNSKYIKDFDFLIGDESTAYKNPNSQRSRAALLIRQQVERATMLSATPTPNGILDIWHQQLLVDLGQRLGTSYYKFRNAVCNPTPRGGFTEWEEKEGIADAVASLIGDCVIRNRLQDCIDIPPNRVTEISFDISPAHRKLYNQMKRQALLQLENGTVSAVNAASLLTKLLQIVSGAVYDELGEPQLIDSDRYELVMELVNQRDHSIVAFLWRHQRDELIKLAKKLDIRYGVIDGSVIGETRTRVVNDFQAGKLRVIFAHPQSAGHGLTLTKGCATIWASPTFNAEHYEQFNARIFRAGQTRETETILISAKNTIDMEVCARLQTKRINMHNLLEMVQ
jgi:SNF2 family DNA or RNA helicase